MLCLSLSEYKAPDGSLVKRIFKFRLIHLNKLNPLASFLKAPDMAMPSNPTKRRCLMFKLKNLAHALLTLSAVFSTQAAIADIDAHPTNTKSARIDGEVFYASGEQINRRPVMLTMTRDDTGEPVFMLQVGKQVLAATAAFMHDVNDGREAYLFFRDAWRVNGGELKHLLLKGWKIGTDDTTIFYGSSFLTTDAQLASSGETLESSIETMRNYHGEVDKVWLHAGGFKFAR